LGNRHEHPHLLKRAYIFYTQNVRASANGKKKGVAEKGRKKRRKTAPGPRCPRTKQKRNAFEPPPLRNPGDCWRRKRRSKKEELG